MLSGWCWVLDLYLCGLIDLVYVCGCFAIYCLFCILRFFGYYFALYLGLVGFVGFTCFLVAGLSCVVFGYFEGFVGLIVVYGWLV